MDSTATNNLRNAVVDTITSELNHLIEGANADIQTWATQIATDTIQAAAEGDTEILAALKDQTLLLLEANRLRAVAGGEKVVLDVVRIVLGLAIKIAIPVIPSI